MNYGMYLSASGALTSMARLNVESNNLANVNTPAFRPDSILVQQRHPARVEDRLSADSDRLIERLGAGVIPTRTFVRTGDGPIRETGQDLDVALRGDGFLVVRTGPNPQDLRLTRDGRMTLSDDGELVRAADGSPVLDAQGRRITLDPARPIHIRSDGVIESDGAPAAQLAVSTVADPTRLIKAGDNLYRSPAGPDAFRPGTARIVHRAVEDSGVNPVKALMSATRAASSAQGNLRMVSLFNDTMGRAINTLGRVS